MGEFERFTPPEARQEAEPEEPDKNALKPEAIRSIRGELPETSVKPETDSQPEAIGERTHWRTPDGNLITPEKEEIYRSPETLPEKEPGFGPKASFSDDPGKTTADDQATDDKTTDSQDDT